MATLTTNTIASTYLMLLKTTAVVDGTLKYIEDAAGTDSALSLSTTRVGIGTAEPTSHLDVAHAGGGYLTISRIGDANISDTTHLGSILFKGHDDSGSNVQPATGAKIVATASGHWTTDDADVAPTELQFWTTNSGSTSSTAQRMVIDKDGNVGIGTEAPSTGNSLAPIVEINGTKPALLIAEADRTDSFLGLQADVGNAQIHFDDSGLLHISHADDVTGTNATPVITFMASGNVGIGIDAPGTRLYVKGAADAYVATFFNEGGTTARAGINVICGTNNPTGASEGTNSYVRCSDGTGDVVGYLQDINGTFADVDPSDIRLKENVTDTTLNGIDKVNSIKVRDFDWKSGGERCVGGFIANELKEVYPQAVGGEEDGIEDIKDSDGNVTGQRILPMTIGRNILVPVLVKAIQELSAKVDALENNNQQGDSSNEQEEPDSGGDASSESSGQDSGGAEGSSSDSADTSDGEPEASESSSDDGDESSGSSGSDAPDDSEAGSGADDSGGSEDESSGDGE